MNVRSRCDCQVDSSAVGLPGMVEDRGGEPSRFASDHCIDRKRIQGRLHDSEPLGSPCAFVGVGSDQGSEVELGE